MPRIYIATLPGRGVVMPPPGVPALPEPTQLMPVAAPKPPTRKGRMQVLLTLHGGERALADVMEGLVERNARAIREGTAPPLSQLRPDQTRLVREPAWYDAPSAITQGRVTRGTLAAWEAGEIRARGHDDVSVAYVSGVPVVVGSNGRQIGDPSLRFGRDPSDRRPPVGGRADLPDEGRVSETLYLTIDDEAGFVRRRINGQFDDALVDRFDRGAIYEGDHDWIGQNGIVLAQITPDFLYVGSDLMALEPCQGAV